MNRSLKPLPLKSFWSARALFTPSVDPIAALLLGLSLISAAPAVRADSGSSVSLSASLSTAVGSVSGSLTASSGSSTGRAREVAAGTYTVTAVQPASDRNDVAPAQAPLRVRVRLDGPQTLVVTMPQAAADQGAVAPGALVAVATRPYGLALIRAGAAVRAAEAEMSPFFLILDDERHAELQARAVELAPR